MRFDVLGPLRVTDGDRLVEIGRPKERAVLAALLVESGSVVPLDRLVDQLWGDEPPARAVGTLHAYISNLRRLLEPSRPPRSPSQLLVSRSPGYCLLVGEDDLDAARFERLTRAARAALAGGSAATALAHVDEALGLWRGPAYADFVYDGFADGARRRLEELHAVAAGDRVDALLALGRHEEAVADLEPRLLADPLHERMWGQLVVALYRSERQADALDACRRARAALDEIGLEPTARMRELEHAVLTQSPGLGPAPLTPAVTLLVPEPRRPPDDSRALAGRVAELAVVDAALAAARTGAGAVLLVEGEAGIGKSAVAAEALARAAAAGAVTAAARCPDGGSLPVLWPWAQLLRQLPPSAAASNVTDLLDRVQDGDASRQPQLVTAVLASLREHAAACPLVLLLDDVQWADEASHRLLQLAVSDLADAAVVILVTMRTPVEPGAALDETVSTLQRAPHTRQIRLRGLDLAATRRIVEQVVVDVTDDLVRAVHDRTGGNPFFTGELARLVVAEHVAGADAVAAAGVPSGVRDVVRRRLSRLPEHANAVLAVAAVVGPDVDVRVVEEVAGLDEDTVIDLFELAAVAGVLAERPDRPGVYRFAHDLVRDAIREGLPGLRRARLHQRALDAVVRVHGDNRRTAHELARHAVGAVATSGAAPAISRLFASSRVALNDLAMELAERQVRIAADLLEELPPSPERDRLEVQVHSRLGQYGFHLRGDLDEAHLRHQHALRLCAPDDVEQLGVVLMGIGAYAPLRGDFAGARTAGTRLLDLATAPELAALRAAGHYICAMQVWCGEVEPALEHIDRALEEAAAVPTGGVWASIPPATVRAFHALVRAVAGRPGWQDDAVAAVESAARERQLWTLAWATAFGTVAATAAGDRDTCAALLRTGESGAILDYVAPVLIAAQAWVDGGDPATAVAAESRLQALGDAMFRAPVLTMAVRMHLDAGRTADAAAAAAQAETVAATTGLVGWLPVLARASGVSQCADVS